MNNWKKHRKRRFTALLLASLMILTGVIPVNTFAVEPDGSIPVSKDGETAMESTGELPAEDPEEPEEELTSDVAEGSEAEPEQQEELPPETERSEASEEPEVPENVETVPAENEESAETEENTLEELPEELPDEAAEEKQEDVALEPSPFSASQADELAYSLLYLMKHADPRYVDATAIPLESMISPVTIARGVATYNAARQRDFDVTERNFLASMAYEIPVYDIDPRSGYYVAMPDVNLYSRDF
ncbi:MAG: hypothetical protein IJH77_00570, partial [Mogibacterium sp.]|nr:hypothetical protein [Mogibacterium sp.]